MFPGVLEDGDLRRRVLLHELKIDAMLPESDG